MKIKSSFILAIAAVSLVPLGAGAKKKPLERGMLEKMESVSCGAKERGLTGLGSVWASAGITHVNSDEKLCPQYLLRTDAMDYEIRPTDGHAAVLPIGHEAEFKINKDQMVLRVADADNKKTATFTVVSVKPTENDAQSSKVSDRTSDKDKASDKTSDKASDKATDKSSDSSSEKSSDKSTADQSPNKTNQP
jgi:hypothetical protein